MSYNLFFKNRKPLASIKIIKKENPDIIVLQEFTSTWKSLIQSHLNYPYKATIQQEGTHGLAVYSKYPVRTLKTQSSYRSSPYVQIVELVVNKKKIQIFNSHFASPAHAVNSKGRFLKIYEKNYLQRKNQYKDLLAYAKQTEHSYSSQVLIGDLNTPNIEPLTRVIKSDWGNSSENNNPINSWTFPNNVPLPVIMKLDYILGRGDIDFIETRVINEGFSDHLPLVSKIRI